MAPLSSAAAVIALFRLQGFEAIKTSSSFKKSPAVACGRPLMSFAEFVEAHHRAYRPGSDEYQRREDAYKRHVEAVTVQNCNGMSRGWKAGVTHLADWTDEELASLRGDRSSMVASHSNSTAAASVIAGGTAVSQSERATRGRKVNKEPLPDSFSWGHLESLQEDRDQGHCGSCWAFAADTCMRANAEIKGLPHKFAVAQVVSCMPNTHHCGGTGGCSGATSELSMDYVMHTGIAQEDEFEYPDGGGESECPAWGKAKVDEEGYKARVIEQADGSLRHLAAENMAGRKVGLLGYIKFAENKLEPMVRALVETGPVVVSVAAGYGWNIYYEGIMSPDGCDTTRAVNHAVTLFGYGTDDVGHGPQKYWIMKNSWGLFWGENGNLRLARPDDEESMCGWDRKPEVGSGCDGHPKKVWVCGSCSMLYTMVQPLFG